MLAASPILDYWRSRYWHPAATARLDRTVQRVDPNAQVDLSGNWNDTDANVRSPR